MLWFLALVLGPFSLVVGLFMTIGSWRDQRDFREMTERGYHAIASIARAYPATRQSGQPQTYLIELRWTDSFGRPHAYGPTHISDRFWRQITTNGELTTSKTEVIALAEAARPVILADIAERKFQDEVGIKAGVAFLLFGLALVVPLVVHLFKNRRETARAVQDAAQGIWNWRRNSAAGRSAELQDAMKEWRRSMDVLLANEANARLVRDSIRRLEDGGFRIVPTLNRDLLMIRVLRECASRSRAGDLEQFFAGRSDLIGGNTFDLLMLLDLAGESDAFDDLYGGSDLQAVLPDLWTLSEDDRVTILDAHSASIFENAASISVVNEHWPGEFSKEKVKELEALAGGDFTVRSVAETEKPEELVVDLMMDDGASARFEMGAAKRMDLSPLFETVNALLARRNKGRFSVIYCDTEVVTAVYLRPNERPAFHRWAERQRFAAGPLLEFMQ
jgi:hypothetical protein